MLALSRYITKKITVVPRAFHKVKSLTCEEEEDQDHNHCVSKVEYGTGHSNYLQL